jgi:hypothetical protein
MDSHCNALNGTDKNECNCVVIPKSIKCIDLSSSCSSKEKSELTSNMKDLLSKCQKTDNATASNKDTYRGLPNFKKSNNSVSDSKNLNHQESNASVADSSMILLNVLMVLINGV